MKKKNVFLEFKISTIVDSEWPEFVEHQIMMQHRVNDAPRHKTLGSARVFVCRKMPEDWSDDTWDRTQTQYDFWAQALTKVIAHDTDDDAIAAMNAVVYIEALDVKEQYRRLGIANHTINMIKKYLAPPFCLVGLSLPRDAPAWLSEFYRSHGFARVGDTQHMTFNTQSGCDREEWDVRSDL